MLDIGVDGILLFSTYFKRQNLQCLAVAADLQVCSVWKVSGSKGWEEARWGYQLVHHMGPSIIQVSSKYVVFLSNVPCV